MCQRKILPLLLIIDTEKNKHTASIFIFEFPRIISLYYTGWGKILSLLSVGHCEGRGGRRRVGLGSKGAGSREVPVTTLPSRILYRVGQNTLPTFSRAL
jgi:hypothetical protein